MSSARRSHRVSERSSFLLLVAKDMLSAGVFPAGSVAIREERIPLVARAYFHLSDSYKSLRIKEDHFTELSKIAALQCVAIMKIEPFYSLDPTNAVNMAQAKPNELFAIYAASIVIKVPINEAVKEDFMFRLLDIMSGCDSLTLEGYRNRDNLEDYDDIDDFLLQLDPQDMVIIDCLICLFEMLEGSHAP